MSLYSWKNRVGTVADTMDGTNDEVQGRGEGSEDTTTGASTTDIGCKVSFRSLGNNPVNGH